MCVVSMIYDHYQPEIDRWYRQPIVIPPRQPTPNPDPAKLRKILDEFQEALEAAKTVDRLTDQADCEDPEKAKLEERVAELERRLDAMQEALRGP